MTERKRGRPKKVGIWLYHLRTGNPANLRTAVYNTDTEVKRAAQKFLSALTDHARIYHPTQYAQLIDIDSQIEKLTEPNTRQTWDASPYEGHATADDAFAWEVRFPGGTTARCEIWRTKA